MLKIIQKVILIVVCILASNLSTIFTFVLGTKVGMEAICLYDGCFHDIQKGDSATDLFEVVAKLPKNKEIVSVPIRELSKFLEKNPNASFLMEEDKGETNNSAWSYVVKSNNYNAQTIKVKYLENRSIEAEYIVSGKNIEPQNIKIMNIGYMFNGMLSVGLPFAIAVLYFARFVLRKIRA